ncbi:carboxypeptidase-like regulatory domain-containing protein [Anatilimnocola sp. NA78]|uniref:carboxypeptidase-like regulatory domain-containing protein n=1 Tax=Anatilimnocola sp. NA78 TaxID=3415683 RepID=UPI003CE46AC2
MLTARLARVVSLAVVALVAAGCTGPGLPKLGLVSGTVTLDGAPYPNAHVTFTPAQGRPSEGMTDSNGKYELTFMPEVKGAQLGEHTVSITTHYQAPENPGSEPQFKEPLPPKYNVQSTLKQTVASGPNEFNFALTSK